MESALLLVQPNAKEVPPTILIRSGLDAVIWFEASRDECSRRALGRRYDNVNEKTYHIQDQPPLTTNAPLCERMTPMDEMENSEATLIDRWMSFDHSAKSIERWFSCFGDAATGNSILRKINADLSEDLVFAQIQDAVDSLLIRKRDKEEELKARIEAKI